ncbi:hypothetical protein MHBO_004349, partial [Bonamia ostreae]
DVGNKTCHYSNAGNMADSAIENSGENTILMTSVDNNCSNEEASFRRKKDDDLVLNVMNQCQESTTVHIHSTKEAGVGEHITKYENVDTKDEVKGYVMKDIIDAVTQL